MKLNNSPEEFDRIGPGNLPILRREKSNNQGTNEQAGREDSVSGMEDGRYEDHSDDILYGEIADNNQVDRMVRDVNNMIRSHVEMMYMPVGLKKEIYYGSGYVNKSQHSLYLFDHPYEGTIVKIKK